MYPLGFRRGLAVFVICGCSLTLSGCASQSRQSGDAFIELEGDNSLSCAEIDASYDNLAAFGEDWRARKTQLDRLAAKKNCISPRFSVNISGSVFFD